MLDGRYELQGAEGVGLHDAVVRADGTPVSILVSLRPFLRDLSEWSRIRHPNLVSVREVGSDGARWFLVVDPVPACTLSDLLAQPIRPEEAARIGADLARALAGLHRAGVVHGVVDPGLIRVGERTVLMAPTRPGSAPYVAPEGVVDARSDVYTLGVLLYRMVAGVVPSTVDPIPPMQIAVPATLEHVARRALQPRPADRYADVDQIARALDAWLVTRAGPTPPPAPRVRSVPRTLGTVVSVGFGAVLLVLGAMVIGHEWWSSRTPPEVEELRPSAPSTP